MLRCCSRSPVERRFQTNSRESQLERRPAKSGSRTCCAADSLSPTPTPRGTTPQEDGPEYGGAATASTLQRAVGVPEESCKRQLAGLSAGRSLSGARFKEANGRAARFSIACASRTAPGSRILVRWRFSLNTTRATNAFSCRRGPLVLIAALDSTSHLNFCLKNPFCSFGSPLRRTRQHRWYSVVERLVRNGAVGNEIVCLKHSTRASHKRAFLYGLFSLRCRFSFLPLPYRPAPPKALGCRLFSLGVRCLISRAFNRTQSTQTNLASSALWEGLRSLPRLLCLEPAVITHRRALPTEHII
jgi:hypothetical protein